MAAAYTTGVSSSPTNLLTTLVSWLVTQGWTSDSSASEGAGWRAHLHKSGVYVNFRAAMNEAIWWRAAGPLYHDRWGGGYGIGLYLGTGYSGASEWYEQAGAPLSPTDSTTMGVGMNLPSGSVAAYHFFDDGSDNIVVVVERSPGIFCHFGFGLAMGEAGQPEDFPYFFGSSSASFSTHNTTLDDDNYGINLTALPPMSAGNVEKNSIGGATPYATSCAFVRVDAATYSGRWVSNGGSIASGSNYSGRYMRCSLALNDASDAYMNEKQYPCFINLIGRVHQSAFAGALMLPLHCFVLTDPGARWAPIGYAPSIFWTEAVGHGYAAGDVYQIGGVDYMLFPTFAVEKGA